MAKSQPLVMWGFHPNHDFVVMKLGTYSNAAARQREKDGWSVAAYAPGDEPAGLRLQAQQEQAVRAAGRVGESKDVLPEASQ